ncbi:MAG: glycosyltransferase family 9 protein [Planctomycetes bacterium]|nr:glycosyltransferase family 9 protein [Planctomycetota bacterium]
MKWKPILEPIALYKPSKWIEGKAICAAVKLKSILYRRRVKAHRSSRQNALQARRVLIAANGGIGNAVEATPLVEAVRMFWPQSEITLMTCAGDLFENWCVPDRIIHDVDEIKGETFDQTFLTYSAHWGKPAWMEQCSCGNIHRPSQYFDEVCLKPEREYNVDMIRRLGYKGPSPGLYVSIKEKADALKDSSMRICFVPGGKLEPRWAHKRWPYYCQLGEILIEKYPDCTVYILGTKEDEIDESLLAAPYVIDMRGKLTLSETAWVLNEVSLAVGNDCGPMHIADAVGSFGVTIFGPSCDLKNSPRNKVVSMYSDDLCRPCQYNRPITCQDPKCIQKITPQIVMEAIEKLL